MKTKSHVKMVIAAAIGLFVLLMPVAIFGAETEGQRLIREAGIDVEWFDPGMEYERAHFINYGSEGVDGTVVSLYLKDGSMKHGVINDKLEIVLPVVYDELGTFEDGLAYAKLNEKMMIIDVSGKEVLDVSRYDYVHSFYNGYCGVSLDGKVGLIDMAGKEVLPCEYSFAYATSQGLLWASSMNGDLEFLFDSTGKKLIEKERVNGFTEDYFIAMEKGKYGIIDRTGKVILPFEYDEYIYPTEDIFALSKNEKWALAGVGEGLITDFLFDYVSGFSEGLACVKIGEKYGFIDKTGEIVVPPEYDLMPGFITAPPMWL